MPASGIPALLSGFLFFWTGCGQAPDSANVQRPTETVAREDLLWSLEPTGFVRNPWQDALTRERSGETELGELWFEARDMDNRDKVPLQGYGFNYWVNSSVYFPLRLPEGANRLGVRAQGRPARGIGPRLRVFLRELEPSPEQEGKVGPPAIWSPENVLVGEALIGTTWEWVDFALEGPGSYEVELRYDNDYHNLTEDRTLRVSHARVTRAVRSSALEHAHALRQVAHTPAYPGLPALVQEWLVQETLAGRSQNGLFAAAPSEIRIGLEVPENGALEVGGGLFSQEWKRGSGALEFIVEIDDGEHLTELHRETLVTQRFQETGWWNQRLSLDAWSQKSVDLVLRTESGEGQENSYPAALWSAPVLLAQP